MLRTACLLPLLALAACSEEVDPTGGADRPFSLYGYLDPTTDRQALRVVSIAPLLTSDTSAAVPASVTSTERETGRAVEWRDSVVTYWDGSVGHVYVASYRPTPGATVDVRVVESGEAPREATVTVGIPPVRPSRVSRVARDVFGTYRVQVDDVPNLQGGTLRVHVSGYGSGGPGQFDVPVEALAPVETEPGAWTVSIPFVSAVRAELERRGAVGTLRLTEVEFVAFVTNEAWGAPASRLPDDVLAEPGTFSNVDGGFGFVGAGYEAPVRWTPSLAAQTAAGFVADASPVSVLAFNEVSLDEGWVEFYNPTVEPIPLNGYALHHRGRLRMIPTITTVPGEGFAVVAASFDLDVGDTVDLVDAAAQPVLSFVIAPGDVGSARPAAYGSYPDGWSRTVRTDGGGLPDVPAGTVVDLFRGPLSPTRGGPNVPAERPVVLNEILSGGGAGWVEIASTLGQAFEYRVVASPVDVLNGVEHSAPAGAAFGVVPGGPELPLPPAGGELLLVARYPDRERGLYVHRVVDVRPYGPQASGRSSGLLPDGPDGDWTEGLLPTRGAPNAAARLGP
jgi:hypothetical protein